VKFVVTKKGMTTNFFSPLSYLLGNGMGKNHFSDIFWRNNVSLGAEGRRRWKELGPLLLFNPLCYWPLPGAFNIGILEPCGPLYGPVLFYTLNFINFSIHFS
jgi:hypothetical protein